ncbi:YpuI family protein [Cytobacillus spongiae]|uniref:YpuI family protein n=1 Tax=Cytobacillus spongiae TaxID=2901381 RepID=UPI001F33DA3A|nr:YpuI family protein [Cytobacillus spongiae]UII54694.1 YpuI family protein [Cytobacillus spongiae]
MGNTIVKSQLEDVSSFLQTTVQELEDFLNKTTLAALMNEKQGDEEYYKAILSHMRKLLVYCEEGLDACHVILQGVSFQKGAAEKTLYRIYHQCIEEFFSPKNDAWFENSRSAYTGKNAIKLKSEVPDSLVRLFKGLEGDFQRIREELEYYETDYRTKMTQTK